MIARARDAVASSPLLSGLSAGEVDELVSLTAPWSVVPGELLFRQGDRADGLYVVTGGRLEATITLPTGEERALGAIEPGSLIGELALLAHGRRLTTVRAVERSEGVVLSAEAFEFLRSQTRPAAHAAMRAIGQSALGRLRRVYELLLDDLGRGRLAGLPLPDGGLEETEPLADAYLRRLLFFAHFEAGEAASVCTGLRTLAGPRGASLDCSDTLWLVLRGAVEVALERDGARRRVRLAGPGRCVGQLVLLDDPDHDLPLRNVLRERAVLLEIPRAVGRRLIDGDLPWERRFATALDQDIARAVIAAEAPQAAVVRHAR